MFFVTVFLCCHSSVVQCCLNCRLICCCCVTCLSCCLNCLTCCLSYYRALIFDLLSQQIKHHERYMKRLEFHLSTVEELYDTYDLHRKLREGVRNMAEVCSCSSRSSLRNSLFCKQHLFCIVSCIYFI